MEILVSWLEGKKIEFIKYSNDEKFCEAYYDSEGVWLARDTLYKLHCEVKNKMNWSTRKVNIWKYSFLAEHYAVFHDTGFYNNPNAIHVKGYDGDEWMFEFSGVGYSSTIYSMKALLIVGVVWIPIQLDIKERKQIKNFRNDNNVPLKRAKVQPPQRAIEIIPTDYIENYNKRVSLSF